MPNWNPSAPDTLGLEWLVHSDGGLVVDSDDKFAAVRLKSTVAETLDAVWAYLPEVTKHSSYMLEAFDAGAEVPTDRQTTRFLPSADVVKENVEADTGSLTNLYAKLAKFDLPEDINSLINYVRRRTTSTRRQRFTARFSTSNALAGRRIVEVRVVLSGNSHLGQVSECLLFDGFNFIGLGKGHLRRSEHNRRLNRLTFSAGEINPYRKLPWRVADVQAFATSLSAGFDFQAVKEARIHQLYLEVVHTAENRRAYGVSSVSQRGWQRFDVGLPDESGNWSKPLGTHTYGLRRIRGGGALTWAFLEANERNPYGAVGYYGRNRKDGTVEDLRGERLGVPAISLEATFGGPYVSEDSQIYAEHTVARVYTGRPARQTFTPGVDGTYGLITVLVRVAAPQVVAALTARVVRASDGVVLGGAATLSPVSIRDLPEVGKNWRVWKVGLSTPASLVANTQYRLELSSVASGQPLGAGTDTWEVGYLDTLGQGASRSYGGTTEFTTVNGVGNANADLPITIATAPLPPPVPPPPPAPDPPTPALSASVVRFEDRLEAVRLRWSKTSLGSRFSRYEIERSDPTTDWQRIAEPTDEATVAFDDFEGRRGVESSYRIRVMRNDGAVSVWTDPAAATPQAVSGRWLFVSNEFPPISKSYYCQEPNSFEILDNQVILELYGRDGAVSFRGLEDRLDAFTLEVWVESDQVGRAVFEELKTLIRTNLSYVCVLDPDGWRWFAALSLGTGVQEWREGLCTIPIAVRELTRTPSKPDPG